MFWYILLGVVIGVIATCIGVMRLNVGVLKIYIPDQVDESPYLYTELDKSVEAICQKEYVIFKVDVRNLHSQD